MWIKNYLQYVSPLVKYDSYMNERYFNKGQYLNSQWCYTN